MRGNERTSRLWLTGVFGTSLLTCCSKSLDIAESLIQYIAYGTEVLLTCVGTSAKTSATRSLTCDNNVNSSTMLSLTTVSESEYLRHDSGQNVILARDKRHVFIQMHVQERRLGEGWATAQQPLGFAPEHIPTHQPQST